MPPLNFNWAKCTRVFAVRVCCCCCSQFEHKTLSSCARPMIYLASVLAVCISSAWCVGFQRLRCSIFRKFFGSCKRPPQFVPIINGIWAACDLLGHMQLVTPCRPKDQSMNMKWLFDSIDHHLCFFCRRTHYIAGHLTFVWSVLSAFHKSMLRAFICITILHVDGTRMRMCAMPRTTQQTAATAIKKHGTLRFHCTRATPQVHTHDLHTHMDSIGLLRAFSVTPLTSLVS